MADPTLDQPARTPARLLLTASFTLSELRAVRHPIETASRRLGLDGDPLDDWITAINELMINVIRHGGGRGTVRLLMQDRLTCEVTDQGPGFDPGPYLARTERPIPTGTGGMGLWLVGQLTDHLSTDSGPAGTTVRIAARVPHRPAS